MWTWGIALWPDGKMLYTANGPSNYTSKRSKWGRVPETSWHPVAKVTIPIVKSQAVACCIAPLTCPIALLCLAPATVQFARHPVAIPETWAFVNPL